MEDSKTSFAQRQTLIIIALCALAIGLRFAAIERSFWLDEIVTVLNVDVQDWKTVLIATSHDNQPPLYNMTVFLWTQLFGYSEVAVRSLSLMFGLLALLTPWLARTSLSTNDKLWNLAILCLMTLPIRYAQEARNYSLLFLLSCSCLYSYYESNAGRTRSAPIVLYVCLALLAVTHIFGVMLALSFLAVMLWRERSMRKRIGLVLLAVVLAAASLAPLLYNGAAKQAGGNFWITFGPKVVCVEMLRLLTPIGIALLVYGLIRWRTASFKAAPDPALLWTLLPFMMMLLGALIISFHTPIFMAHYLIGFIPAYALFVCWLLKPAVSGTRPVAVVFIFFLLLVQAFVLTFSPFLFVQENLRQIARNSIAWDTKVCYVTSSSTPPTLGAAWSYYVTQRFGRPDLAPLIVAESSIPETVATRQCGLWADAHMARRGVTILSDHPQLAGCRDVPLGRPGVATATALWDCRTLTSGSP